jgi:hypothetical protein
MSIPNIKIILIQNFLSSGTTLLHSILDNHPEVLQLPGLRARNLVSFWINNKKRKKNIFINTFINENNSWFVKTKNELWEAETISLLRFKLNLTKLLNNHENFKCFILAVHQAYYVSKLKNFGKLKNYKVLVFPIHSLDKKYHKIFIDNFSDIFYIFCIRNPYVLFNSGINHLWYLLAVRKKKFLINSQIILLISQFFLDLNLRNGISKFYSLKTPYKINKCIYLKNEDIHNKTKFTLKLLCKKINIKYNQSLLKTTFGGKIWSNRNESKNISGIGKHNIKKKIIAFDNIYFELINFKFNNFLKKFKYKKILINKKFLLFRLIFVISKLERNSFKCFFQQNNFKKNETKNLKYIYSALKKGIYLILSPFIFIFYFIILRILLIIIYFKK